MILINIVLTGIGATVLIDLWSFILKAFGIKGLNMAHLGRWVLHIPKGQWFHESIAKSPAVDHELLVGWLAHYAIGIGFSFLLMLVYGSEWFAKPELKPALIIGVLTVLAPLTILQPALGLGYFASNSPTPILAVLKSIGTHTVFGLGLFLTAYGLVKLR